MSNPIVILSSCGSASSPGNPSFNGGYKLYNIWVKLLRQHNIESYILTWDGNYAPWLIEQQPTISYGKFISWKKDGRPLRCVTAWLDSPAFLEDNDFYLYDCELTHTLISHMDLLKNYLSRIVRIGVNNKSAQAWYNCNFPGREILLLPEWSDEEFWKPDPSVRVTNQIGYMAENVFDQDCLDAIKVKLQHLNLNFVKISGDEVTVLKQMQTCDIFIGLNPGKHVLWGEGCPRTQQEAMHAGAVVAAFDVRGNREYLVDGYTGYLSEVGDIEDISKNIERLIMDPPLKENIRENSVNFALKAFSSSNKMKYLKRFLDL